MTCIRLLSVTLLVVTGIVLATATTGMAHGMNYSILESQSAVVFQAQFSNGEPMSYSAVVINDPTGREHQSGLTDAQGRFAFIPESKGKWQVAVDGGMGHRLAFDMEAGADIAEIKAAKSPQWLYALIGLSLTINLGLGVSLIRKRT